MIPNIIHYCWFSDDEMPPIVKKCIDSWHRYMPDYEYRLWDMDSIREIDVPFLREALECRKWAFAADYVRLWAVEKYGGIYIDSDVEVFKSLDEFRNCSAFIGREEEPNILENRPMAFLTSHLFGAEAHHPFIKDCMAYYESRHYKISDNPRLPDRLRYEWRIAPEVAALVAINYGYNPYTKADCDQKCSDGMVVYNSSLFFPLKRNKNSVCYHYCLGSWRVGNEAGMMPTDTPWWRDLLERMNLGAFAKRLLLRLGYVAYKL